MGLVGELFKYQVRVDDKNENASLEFTLMKGPAWDANGSVR